MNSDNGVPFDTIHGYLFAFDTLESQLSGLDITDSPNHSRNFDNPGTLARELPNRSSDLTERSSIQSYCNAYVSWYAGARRFFENLGRRSLAVCTAFLSILANFFDDSSTEGDDAGSITSVDDRTEHQVMSPALQYSSTDELEVAFPSSEPQGSLIELYIAQLERYNRVFRWVQAQQEIVGDGSVTIRGAERVAERFF